MKQKKRMFVISATAMLLTASITQTVTIPVEATELQQTQDDQYYLFEDSSYRLLEYEDISTISTADIRIAKNEIYARHGRKFSSEDLQQYFSQLPWYQGTIEFTKIDKEECDIMVFNTPYGFEGVKSFSGKEMSFEEFKKQYPNAEFEIVTEGYCGYDTTFQGYIWQEGSDPLFGIMRIWNMGDMIYRI